MNLRRAFKQIPGRTPIEHSFQRLHMRISVLVLLVTLLTTLVGCGSGSVEFGRPALVVTDPDESRVVVYDNSPRRILILDSQFKLIREITHPLMQNVWGLTLGLQGEILAATECADSSGLQEVAASSSAVAAILRFDRDGRELPPWIWRGRQGPLIKPIQITALPDATYLVTDAGVDRIFRLNDAGVVIGASGQNGSAPGQVYFPSDIKRLPSGKVLLTDAFNSRVQEFRLNELATQSAPASGTLPEILTFERVVLENGMEPGKVRFPQYLAVAPSGNWYVSEFETMRVSEFDQNGTLVRLFNPTLSDAATGTETFFELFGVAWLPKSKRLLVADSLNAGIHVFAEDGRVTEFLRGPKP
ncbi:MAG TPA: NHL repeat-containing protein [Candidatus Ozemobacteraceae bacterium]|nr:NHL repeat-containing protein [Candidatus Ozemobacteraceae bacterium]